jgi:WhiB family transcriptional regulator, redox-sensing transcriptional regulator
MSILQRDDRDGWQAQAACAGEVNSIFYPPMRGEPRRAKRSREARAKAVCAQCQVRSDCLEQAIDTDERYGIWGGMTDRERRVVMAEREQQSHVALNVASDLG